jgi:DNA-binding NtrC family response regulator
MGGTILIVRRDDDLLWAMSDALQVDGHEVHSAPTIEAALRTLGRGVRPDVLLVDEESVGALGCARLEGVADGAPRILTTWNPRPTPAGTVRLLRQPFSLREFRDTLADALASARRGSPGGWAEGG